MKRKKGHFESKTLGYLMTIPATILILSVSIVPLVQGILMSFENYNVQQPHKRAWVWFDNFVQLFQDEEFVSALIFTFLYTFATVVISYVVGLALAMLLSRNLKGKGLFRTLALLPWVVAPSVAAVNWILLLNDRIGVVNRTLLSWGLIEEPILFIADPVMARFTVIMTDVWRDYPFMMIVLLAGIQSIPKDLYESAYIDGAGYWKSFWYITLPMIKNVSAVCTILMFIWVFNHFDNIYLLTAGGPNGATFTMSIWSYFTAFYRGDLGYASAGAVIMLIVLLIVALIYLRVTNAFSNKEES